jgi:hypothetical protein
MNDRLYQLEIDVVRVANNGYNRAVGALSIVW